MLRLYLKAYVKVNFKLIQGYYETIDNLSLLG